MVIDKDAKGINWDECVSTADNVGFQTCLGSLKRHYSFFSVFVATAERIKTLLWFSLVSKYLQDRLYLDWMCWKRISKSGPLTNLN